MPKDVKETEDRTIRLARDQAASGCDAPRIPGSFPWSIRTTTSVSSACG